jgi:hypothetical protein
MRALLIILFFTVCVVVGAAGDAMMLDSKLIAHPLQAVEVLLLLCGAAIFRITPRQLIAWVVVYVCIRVAGFDYLYNLFAGLPWDFHGTTSIWDRFLGSHPEHGIAFSKTVFLMIGIGVAYYEL